MPDKNICQNNGGCDNPAIYNMYKHLPGGRKVWLEVCRWCEEIIAYDNIKGDLKKRGKGNYNE